MKNQVQGQETAKEASQSRNGNSVVKSGAATTPSYSIYSLKISLCDREITYYKTKGQIFQDLEEFYLKFVISYYRFQGQVILQNNAELRTRIFRL